MIGYLDWLRNTKEPWSEVLRLWVCTFTERVKLAATVNSVTGLRQSVLEYLLEYKAFSDPAGYQLVSKTSYLILNSCGLLLFESISLLFSLQIETDFDLMHPDKKMRLFTKWPMFAAFVEKNVQAKQVLNDIRDSITPGTLVLFF